MPQGQQSQAVEDDEDGAAFVAEDAKGQGEPKDEDGGDEEGDDGEAEGDVAT